MNKTIKEIIGKHNAKILNLIQTDLDLDERRFWGVIETATKSTLGELVEEPTTADDLFPFAVPATKLPEKGCVHTQLPMLCNYDGCPNYRHAPKELPVPEPLDAEDVRTYERVGVMYAKINELIAYLRHKEYGS